ncbi:tetratricopeptide repeat protein [Azospirillum canadense]|uniref:tetratricopeptide repeat protein n=1 Tax=Azospirillum canadense TaxID=403962 RepID=UPI002225D13F|nr:tetratricopeptide repeat protein [Azospirillum canadense]MCW2241244.1 TolB-like protein/Tfp pilus assembly protein PilF [Azospirillum canadense]
MPQSSGEAIPPALIDEALERVLASRGFRGSARKQRFLRFIVQETLAGHADRIKAYAIAIDVFDRDASFDPLLDPVVRIHAGRVRRCLEQYYLTDGASDAVRITIPKGSYVPQFTGMPAVAPFAALHSRAEHQADGNAAAGGRGPGEPAGDPAQLSTPPWRPRFRFAAKPRTAVLASAVLLAVAALLFTLWGVDSIRREPSGGVPPAFVERGPALLVVPFANGSTDPSQDIFAEGYTEELIGALVRFKNVLVFGAETSFRYKSAAALRQAEPNLPIDYVLKGSVAQVGGQIQVTAVLIDAKTRRYLWSDNVRRDLTAATMVDLRQDIAVRVARALVQPNGVIEEEEARHAADRPPTALSSYECLLRTRQYWRHLDADLHGQVRTCLERAVQTDPLYADAWAALAMVTIDETRLGFNPRSADPDPLATGLELAQRAVALAPDSPLPHQALGLAYWLRREPQLSIAAYERARALNPHGPDILADLGRCYSLVGDWQTGIPLIQEAYARNPAQPSWYRIVIATYHYVNGRYDEALAEAQRVDVPEFVLSHVALAMIHAQAGHKSDAAREVREILRLDPDFGAKIVPELERRNIAPPTIAKILDGVRKAGLAVPSG